MFANLHFCGFNKIIWFFKNLLNSLLFCVRKVKCFLGEINWMIKGLNTLHYFSESCSPNVLFHLLRHTWKRETPSSRTLPWNNFQDKWGSLIVNKTNGTILDWSILIHLSIAVYNMDDSEIFQCKKTQLW